MRTAAGLVVLAVGGAALAGTSKVDRFTEVNGTRYRVEVRGKTFTVFKKAAVIKDTIEERDAQREAVRRATGCEPIDELHRDARLRGKLDCAK